MTEYLKYKAGEKHSAWELNVAIHQNYDNYKFVLADNEDDMYIATNYVSPATANALQDTIDAVMEQSVKYESIEDVYKALQSKPCGTMFYELWTVSPDLSDAVLLLAIR